MEFSSNTGMSFRTRLRSNSPRAGTRCSATHSRSKRAPNAIQALMGVGSRPSKTTFSRSAGIVTALSLRPAPEKSPSSQTRALWWSGLETSAIGPSELNKPAPQTDGDCVRAVTCAEFLKDALKVSLHRMLGNAELVSDGTVF